jgi:ZIP family zinc transporter
VLEALWWGAFASSSLLIGAAIALRLHVSRRALGLVLGFGAGVLLSAVAFELVEEAFETSGLLSDVAIGLFAGCAVFSLGDALIDRMGGEARKNMDGGGEGSSGLAIVLGTVLDGIPESAVLGLSLIEGGTVSAAMLVAVFLSNLPEAIAATSGIAASGWRASRVFLLWGSVVAVSALASVAGFGLFDGASPSVIAFVLAFAGGAILTMLADTMMPEAYAKGGKWAGVVTTLGFATAFAISAFE